MGNFCDKDSIIRSLLNDDDDVINARNIIKSLYYIHLLGEKDLLINTIEKKLEYCDEYEKLICKLNTNYNRLMSYDNSNNMLYKKKVIDSILELKKKALEDNVYIDNTDNVYIDNVDNVYIDNTDNVYIDNVDNVYINNSNNVYIDNLNNDCIDNSDNVYNDNSDDVYIDNSDYIDNLDNIV
jgi:hypothetical protein